jgi:hypothetical protein
MSWAYGYIGAHEERIQNFGGETSRMYPLKPDMGIGG